MSDDIKRDWQSGMSYSELHRKYFSPAQNCECDDCEAARKSEREEEQP